MKDPWQIAQSLIGAYGTTGGKFAGDIPLAELEEALEISRKIGDSWGAAHSLAAIGDLMIENGEVGLARLRYEESLQLFRELKDRWLTAWVLEGLGRTSWAEGDPVEGEKYSRESLKLFDILGDEGNCLYMIHRLGMIARYRKHHHRAACLLGASIVIQEYRFKHHAAQRMEYPEEFTTACSEYEAGFPDDWKQGQEMTSKQAVGYALEDDGLP